MTNLLTFEEYLEKGDDDWEKYDQGNIKPFPAAYLVRFLRDEEITSEGIAQEWDELSQTKFTYFDSGRWPCEESYIANYLFETLVEYERFKTFIKEKGLDSR